MKSRITLLVIALSLTLGSHSAAAKNDGCKPVSGPFTSTIVAGPECESPVGICTLGLLEGNFHATYEFTMLTLVPVDPANPAILAYTGVSVITLRSGQQLFAVDTGIMDTTDPTAAPFETIATITGGTGQYVSGQIVATGILNLVTGEAVGSHAGEICKDKKNRPRPASCVADKDQNLRCDVRGSVDSPSARCWVRTAIFRWS